MDTKQFVLVLALSLVSMMLWQAWQEDYGKSTSNTITKVIESDKPDLQTSTPIVVIINKAIIKNKLRSP